MSEQSPWGTPTPPTYGPPPGQPVGPPPAGPPGGYGYGGPGGPGGYGGPPPKKSHTGLFVTLAILGIVVIAGIAVTLVLVLKSGGGDNTADDPTSPTSSATDTASDSPTDPLTTSTDPTPSEPTTSSAPKLPPKDASTVSGDGYRFERPDGWQTASKSVRKSIGATIDGAILYGGPSIPLATANILIEREDTGGITNVKLVEPYWKKNLRAAAGKKLDPISEISLDGERAVGVQVSRTNESGVDIHQVFYLAVHDGASYTVGLSERTDDTGHDADFKDVLTTWRWTS